MYQATEIQRDTKIVGLFLHLSNSGAVAKWCSQCTTVVEVAGSISRSCHCRVALTEN